MYNQAPALALPKPVMRSFLSSEASGPGLAVYRVAGEGPAVLYVHGSTFPAQLSINYRIGGISWADDLQARGFDVWSFDFAGYGASNGHESMRLASVARDQVPGRAAEATHQIERVVRYILSETDHRRVSIVAHSWGSIPAGLFSGTHPELVDRLVLFGPIAQREGDLREFGPVAPTIFVTAADQWASFQSRSPMDAPLPISKDQFDIWVKAYLESDPTSRQRTPRSARAPAGPELDFRDAWSGQFPYDPAIITRPTAIVRGEWDAVTQDDDAAWLTNAMRNVPDRARDLKLPGGAHRMHLEGNRQALFEAVGAYLSEEPR